MALVIIGYSACPLTRKAFEDAGHEAWTCDFLPARDGSNRHLQCDVWEAIEEYDWDFGIFHPMCTYLTVSAAWAYKDPDFKRYPGVGYHQRVKPGTLTGEARRQARDEELKNFERLLSLRFPALLENPALSFINTAIRPPDQIIHPFQFGDDASKATGLWSTSTHTHTIPTLQPTSYVNPRLVCSNGHVFAYGKHRCPRCGSEKYLPRWANQTDSGQNRLSPDDNRWLERSKTYPGIAAALGHQYGKWLKEVSA